MATALTIKVKENEKLQGASGMWINDLSTQMPRITSNIITPDVQGDGQISAIVSGIPTAFARPVLFEKALGYSSNMGQGTSDGLHKYYSSLVDEWRGLIACLALDTDANSLNVETVTLAYSDGKGYKDTQNIYEPKGAFGNMLLDERNLWCDQTATDFKLVSPQISIIKYRGRVIGGTSPKVLVFTSAMYEIEDSLPYVNPKTKKFTDPLKLGTLTPSQYLNLYAYLNKLMDRFSGLSGYFKQQVPDYTAIQKELQAWLDEIDKVIVEKNYDKSKASPLPVSYFKQEPYRSFFNYSNDLYSVNGIIYSEEKEHAISFKPSSLLLPHDTELVHVRFVRPDYAKDLSKLPLALLRASRIDGNGYDDFALPLSETGIKVFEKNIDALLRTKDTPSDIGSSLRASYDPKNNNTLKVELNITTKEGVLQSITVNYRVNNNILQNTVILMWPNFASAQWNKYFLYSEMPHDDHTNDCPFETVPFCGNCDTPQFDIIAKKKGNNASESEIALLAKDGHAQKSIEGLDVQLDVVSDYRTNDQRYKYEIYECSKPFRGIQISRAGKVCGYFLIRYTTDKDMTELPYNYGTTQMELVDVNLGVDFGSTNTSVAYSTERTKPEGFTFHDQRISLLGGTHIKKDHDKLPTLESSVFFFQRDSIGSNMVKSMLTLHDKLRMPDGKDGEPVVGGFPCFSRDLPISLVKGDHISLLFKNSGAKAEIVNDMKWKGDDADKNHRTAFLSTLMLHVYAELFTKKLVPVTLKWSYPSAMGFNLLQQYSELWNKLSKISPVICGGEQKGLKVYPRPDITVNTDDGSGFPWTEDQPQIANGSFSGASASSPWDNDQQNPWGSSFGGDNGSSTPQWGSSDNGVSGTNGQMQGWGSEDISDSGWDCDPSESGWGQPKATAPKIKDLVPDNGPIEFNIKPLPKETSVTEACAVANYNIAQDTDSRFLTLCFDIGGSTTDISAICYMNGEGGQHPTLIKQNSIRFAAQRISKATSVLYVPFKKVLLDICNSFNLRLTGLNRGEDKYNAETAPYFYEQIVDMLTPEQQVAFYQKIAADCPGLFSVNLYVTGLIMYYAGQITEKLVKEVRRAKDGKGDKWHPNVKVTFAGKGSRIFDWFSCINKEGAKQYRNEQFIHGMGGMREAMSLLAGPPQFVLDDKRKKNIKYEVAFGLADQDMSLYVPGYEGGIEILGEEGFSIIAASTGESTPLEFDNSVTSEMMQQLGVYFMPPSPNSPCKRFMDFAYVFSVYAKKFCELNMTPSEFMEGFRNMNINSYINNQPEYRAAKLRSTDANGKFDYVNPIIILEGMKFYDDYLLKGIVK